MAKKRINIDPRKLEGSKLYVVDVNAVMHSNFVPLREASSGADSFSKNPYARFQKRELSWEVEGEKFNTSALYGLMRLFITYGFDSHYVFCFDTPKNIRKMESPEYKSGRPKKDAELYDQLNVAREILENVGFKVHYVEGFEADDFVVETVSKNKELFDNVIVVSNDYDLGQTIDDNVMFRNVISRNGDINKDNYEEMLECPYNSIVLYKAMVGDGSDKIKGIYRFGKKKFYNFIKDEGIYGELSEIRKKRKEYDILKNTVLLTEEQRASALYCLGLVVPRLPKGYGEGWDPKQSIDRDMMAFYLEKYGMFSVTKKL